MSSIANTFKTVNKVLIMKVPTKGDVGFIKD